MDIAAERSYPTPLANITLLPMLLMSLMRQKHTPRTAETVKREYDYIIVGAGSAGSVVASRLSELPCVSVLLLEAGKSPPLLTDVPAISRSFWFTDIDWQYKTVPQKRTGALLNNRQVVWPGGKAIGGSSILNGMLYVRGNRKNFDQWAAEGAEGWSYQDVLPYFKKMEDNRDPEYLANGYHAVHGPQTVHRPRYQPEMKDPIFECATSMGYRIVDPNGPSQTGFYDFQSTMRAGQRCSTAKAYLVPAENRTNLDILPNAFVKKILIKKRRAVGVQFDYDGKSYIVNARREVILSAGTVNTAQLLMLSGIGPRRELERFKIPVVADLPVGRNLQDHCTSNVDFELDPSIQPSMEKLIDLNNIAQYIQNRTGPLGSSEFFNTIAFLKNKVVEPDEDFPDYQILFAESNSGSGLQFGLTPEAQAKIYEPYEGRPFYSCFSGPLQPRSRGTVTLQSDDPYDPPLIDPNYFDDPRDIDNLVEGLKLCNRIGNSPALKKVGSTPRRTLIPGCEKYAKNEDLYLRCQVRAVIMTASHPVGTARMGNPRDPRTVVDSELRVKTLKGLRVVDASVMPIIPSGNINAATIMVAEKASDIIKATIECPSEGTDDDRFPVLEEIAFSGGPTNFTKPDDDRFPVLEEIAFSGGPVNFTKADLHSHKKHQTADNISEDSQNKKSIDKRQYGYIPPYMKQWNSDLQASVISSQSKDSIPAASDESDKLRDKPKYGYIPVNKNKWRDNQLNVFTENEGILSSDAWNREIISPDFTDFVFPSNRSLFQTGNKLFNALSSKFYTKQTEDATRLTENEPQNEQLSDNYSESEQQNNNPQNNLNDKTSQNSQQNDLNDKNSQPQSAASLKGPRSKSKNNQKMPPNRKQPQKVVTKSESNSSKNQNKKRLPSKFDSLRVKVGKSKTLLLSVEGSAKNLRQTDQENSQKQNPSSTAESPTVNPPAKSASDSESDSQSNFESDPESESQSDKLQPNPNVETVSDSESNSSTDSDENKNLTSSCEKDFCKSLLNFMKCGETKSCQKKIEFAALLLQLLCINE